MSKVKISDLKEYLSTKNKTDLCLEILTVCKTFKEVSEYYSVKINPVEEEAAMGKYREIIVNEFCPARGLPKMRYSIMRKALSDFKKISNNPHHITELMLSQVESGVTMTNEFGDIDEQFYTNIENMFDKVCKYICEHHVEDEFQTRCEEAMTNSGNIGWGFSDAMTDIYEEHFENI